MPLHRMTTAQRQLAATEIVQKMRSTALAGWPESAENWVATVTGILQAHEEKEERTPEQCHFVGKIEAGAQRDDDSTIKVVYGTIQHPMLGPMPVPGIALRFRNGPLGTEFEHGLRLDSAVMLRDLLDAILAPREPEKHG